eukprot:6099325-Amphidinium_carterae.1
MSKQNPPQKRNQTNVITPKQTHNLLGLAVLVKLEGHGFWGGEFEQLANKYDNASNNAFATKTQMTKLRKPFALHAFIPQLQWLEPKSAVKAAGLSHFHCNYNGRLFLGGEGWSEHV